MDHNQRVDVIIDELAEITPVYVSEYEVNHDFQGDGTDNGKVGRIGLYHITFATHKEIHPHTFEGFKGTTVCDLPYAVLDDGIPPCSPVREKFFAWRPDADEDICFECIKYAQANPHRFSEKYITGLETYLTANKLNQAIADGVLDDMVKEYEDRVGIKTEEPQ